MADEEKDDESADEKGRGFERSDSPGLLALNLRAHETFGVDMSDKVVGVFASMALSATENPMPICCNE